MTKFDHPRAREDERKLSMEMKVVKFGGSSLADADHFRQVAQIVKSDPDRHYVVASAPGKRFSADIKVTDMLYHCYDMIRNHEDITDYYQQIKDRYTYILTSGETNSLAASMEILSFLNKHGGKGEILHGDIEEIAQKIKLLVKIHNAKKSLKGKNIGSIGKPSSWLIASNYSPDAMMEKLGLGFVDISMEEMIVPLITLTPKKR